MTLMDDLEWIELSVTIEKGILVSVLKGEAGVGKPKKYM